MKKFLLIIATLIIMACSCFLLVACNDNGGGDDARIIEVYNSYVVYAQENGVEPLSYEQWLATIKGEKGDKGDKGDQGQDGKDGKDGKDGADGKDGKDGIDGEDGKEIKTAIIDANGDLIITYTDNTTVNAGNVVVKNPTLDENNKITFKNIELDGNNGFIKVANGTTTFSFLDEIELNGNVGYTVSTDMFGLNVIPTKTVELIDGDNVFYVLETCGNDAKLYTITIRRDLHTVKFNTNGGSNVDTLIVKTGDTISVPVSKKDGYGVSWDYNFNSPITEDIIINANWTAIFTRSGNKIDGLTEYGKTLSEITIPASIDGVEITSIGDYAFNGCVSLTSIKIPSTLTAIGLYAFYNSLSKVYYGGTIDQWVEIDFAGDMDFWTEYGVSNPLWYGGVELYINNTLVTHVEITTATKISEFAFINYGKLECITIGDSVQSIGKGAFRGCTNLKTVTFGDNSQLQMIGEYAFFRCVSLQSIIIPSGVTSIGEYAFRDCNSLQEIILPSSVVSIGDGAFIRCNSLKTITFGANSQLQSIGSEAFNGCSSLTSIVIPNSVTSIDLATFRACTSLTSIVIPSSVTSIGESAFDDCSKLKSVYYGGTAEDWAKISINRYENSSLTSATRYYYIENEIDVPTDDGNYWHYVDGVPTVWVKE